MKEYVTVGTRKIYKEDVVGTNGKDLLYVWPAGGEPFSVKYHNPETIKRLILHWQGKSGDF
jgi:hypothetical protein